MSQSSSAIAAGISSSRTPMTRLLVLCALSILSSGTPSAVAMDESASSSSAALQSSGQHELHYTPLVDARDQLAAGGKRAYTYRSEYKRLPLYTFGLGKRWAQAYDDKRSQRFAFGLGKRTRPYSFGLGKRSSYDDAGVDEAAYGYMPADLYDAYTQREVLENYLQGKRSAGGFNFGLGKRETGMRTEDELQEKMPVKHLRDKYLFGLGKRFYQEPADDDEDVSASQLV